MDNDSIPESRKYDVYKKMKQAYIDKAKADYKFLCYTINGSSESTGKSAITCEYARELLNYSEDMNTVIEVMIKEKHHRITGRNDRIISIADKLCGWCNSTQCIRALNVHVQ